MNTTHGRKIRLCVIANTVNIGGAETQLLRLCRYIDPSCVEIEVIYYGGRHALRSEYEATPAKITFFDRDAIGRVKFILQLTRYLYKGNYDIIHCWRGTANQYGGLAALLSGQRCIVTGHRDLMPTSLVERVFDRFLSFFSVGRVVNSHAILESHSKATGIPKHKMFVLHNGLDIEEFESSADRKKIRSLIGVPADRPFIVSVGRLIRHKRHDVFIDVAALLTDRGYNCHYALIGEGPIQEVLQNRITKLGIENRFQLLGSRKDVPSILAASDISVCTSLSEGFPNVVLESMMAGVPVITSDNGGGPELVDMAKQVVPVGNVKALADKLGFLLDNSEERLEWSEYAKKRAETNFRMDVIADCYIEILRDMLARSRW